jgi:hypothetical protein
MIFVKSAIFRAQLDAFMRAFSYEDSGHRFF